MKAFPNESNMERSQDGSEPIRGGSIGFNRIYGGFVEAANKDQKPRFHAVIISAFTIFRNVWNMKAHPSLVEFEDDFVRDIDLFLLYFDTYLSLVWSRIAGDKFCPVIIYFPDYKHIPKDIEREQGGKDALIYDAYKKFMAKHSNTDNQARVLEHCRCFLIRAGDATYPHKEVARKFREITHHPMCLYTSGDPICLITHVPLDLYISGRLREIQVLESYTARIRPAADSRFKLDKEGRVPFQPAVHVALGDGVLIKQKASRKQRKQIFDDAEKDKWLTRSEEDVRNRVAKICEISSSALRRYDFV